MFSENEIRNIMFQVLSGLAFVHKHGKRLYSVCCFLLPNVAQLLASIALGVLVVVKCDLFDRCFCSNHWH